jgi:hypothetical protein
MTAPWQASWRRAIRGPSDAARFVQTFGFCTWGPLPGLAFPNLAQAMGETASSVLGRTWFWKDDLHIQRRVFYGKIIAGAPTFIAPDYLPDFVAALGGRAQSGERDVAYLYREGRISHLAHAVHASLVTQPAQPTRALRRASGARGAAGWERALVELQRRFVICKVDLTGRTRGTYSYVWDLADRFWPDAFAEARGTAPGAARSRIRGRLSEFGLLPSPGLEAKLFLWQPEQ